MSEHTIVLAMIGGMALIAVVGVALVHCARRSKRSKDNQPAWLRTGEEDRKPGYGDRR